MCTDKTGGTGDKVGFGRTDVALRPDSEHEGSRTP